MIRAIPAMGTDPLMEDAVNSISSLPKTGLLGIFSVFTLLHIWIRVSGVAFPFRSYLNYYWIFFLSLTVSTRLSPVAGIWILAIVSFAALREYFSLIAIRLEDRLGILVAYLSIPFMYYYIQIDWYGMFIISIPVYAFLAIPLLVSLGGKRTEGIVFSIGAIDLGLFLLVYCVGHLGYLMRHSVWMAGMMLICIAVCDFAIPWAQKKTGGPVQRLLAGYAAPLPVTVAVAVALSAWTGVPLGHSIILGALIPLLALMGHHTIGCIESDLGIPEDAVVPGQGQVIDSLKTLFYVAPVFYHYIRYFLT